jgi:hypothetical protein
MVRNQFRKAEAGTTATATQLLWAPGSGRGGSTLMRPGSRKVAGDTLWEPEMPPQPVASEQVTSRKPATCDLVALFIGAE